METENIIVRTVQGDLSPNFLNLLSKHCTSCYGLRLQRPHRSWNAQFSVPRAINLVIDSWLQMLIHQWSWAQCYWNLQSQVMRFTLSPKGRVTFHCTVYCFHKGSFSQNLLTCQHLAFTVVPPTTFSYPKAGKDLFQTSSLEIVPFFLFKFK